MPVARQHAVEVSVIIFDFSWERESERGRDGEEQVEERTRVCFRMHG